MRRNALGGLVVPVPGGYEREHSRTMFSGTEAMAVGPVWSCKECGCRGVRAADGSIGRRPCRGSCECHAIGIAEL